MKRTFECIIIIKSQLGQLFSTLLYALNVYSTKEKAIETVCKVEGITLNFKNSKLVNFDLIKRMVCKVQEDPVYVVNDRKISRTAGFNIVSKPENKVYRVNYTKRRRLNNEFDTLPFGY